MDDSKNFSFEDVHIVSWLLGILDPPVSGFEVLCCGKVTWSLQAKG